MKKLYWTKERCHEVSLVCKSRYELQKKYISVYISSLKNGWLDEICSHMIKKTKPTGYWNKELCLVESLKFKSRNDFRLNSKGAYSFARRMKWLDDICLHMVSINKPRDYWTKDRCKEISKQYDSRKSFSLGVSAAYHKSRTNKWLDEFFPKITK